MTNDQIKSGGELLPCPFCGDEALLDDVSDFLGYAKWTVACQNEDCFTHGGNYETQDHAAAAWNSRTPSHGRVSEEVSCVSPSGPGSHASHEAPAGLRLPVSIPDVDRFRAALSLIRDTLSDCELNMSNYDEDGVSHLNQCAIDAYLAADEALIFQPRKEDTMIENNAEPMLARFQTWPLNEQADVIDKQNIIGNVFWTMFCDLTALLPSSAERTVALRKILEARDSAMRVAAGQ